MEYSLLVIKYHHPIILHYYNVQLYYQPNDKPNELFISINILKNNTFYSDSFLLKPSLIDVSIMAGLSFM